MKDMVDKAMPLCKAPVQRLVQECKSPEELLAVASCLLQLTQDLYVAALSPKGAAEMFYQVADSLAANEKRPD